jgi:hypothetical protein
MENKLNIPEWMEQPRFSATETITVDRQKLWQMVCEHSARVAEKAIREETIQGSFCTDEFMDKNFPAPNVGDTKG